jgi:hypothetical protein
MKTKRIILTILIQLAQLEPLLDAMEDLKLEFLQFAVHIALGHKICIAANKSLEAHFLSKTHFITVQ